MNDAHRSCWWRKQVNWYLFKMIGSEQCANSHQKYVVDFDIIFISRGKIILSIRIHKWIEQCFWIRINAMTWNERLRSPLWAFFEQPSSQYIQYLNFMLFIIHKSICSLCLNWFNSDAYLTCTLSPVPMFVFWKLLNVKRVLRLFYTIYTFT